MDDVLKVFHVYPSTYSEEEINTKRINDHELMFPLIKMEFGTTNLDITESQHNYFHLSKMYVRDSNIIVMSKGWKNDDLSLEVYNYAKLQGKRIIDLENNNII